MDIIDIKLEKGENPIYWEFVKRHNEIMEKHNAIDDAIWNISINKEGPKRAAIILRQLSQNLPPLQAEFLTWKDQLRNFLANPRFVVADIAKTDVTFHHFMNVLFNLCASMDATMSRLIGNYNTKDMEIKYAVSERRWRTSFWLALAGTIASLIGLTIALVK